jgi:hypothetical protein
MGAYTNKDCEHEYQYQEGKAGKGLHSRDLSSNKGSKSGCEVLELEVNCATYIISSNHIMSMQIVKPTTSGFIGTILSNVWKVRQGFQRRIYYDDDYYYGKSGKASKGGHYDDNYYYY